MTRADRATAAGRCDAPPLGRPPPDRARWIGGGVIALWAAVAAVLLSSRGEHDPQARARTMEFQTRVGAHAVGPALDGLAGRAFLPGMTESVGPSDYVLLPGGFGIGGHGADDAFPYVGRTEDAPRPASAAP